MVLARRQCCHRRRNEFFIVACDFARFHTFINNLLVLSGGLKVNSKDIQSVSQFTYLGSLVTDDNRTDAEMKTRFGKAAAAVNKLSKIWNNRSSSIYK